LHTSRKIQHAVGLADWGYGDTSPYKTLLNHDLDEPATPRLQQMADEGTTYTNFRTLGAECSPSRASWMTGRSPSDRLVRINLVIGNHAVNVGKGCGDYVPVSTPTVFSTMHAAGYFVAHYGKVSRAVGPMAVRVACT
jgi:arylsulfatase A-like enzyme